MGAIFSYFYPKPKLEASVDQVLEVWEIEDMIHVDNEAREHGHLEFLREPRQISDPISIPKKNNSSKKI